jgi:hypothetical protein
MKKVGVKAVYVGDAHSAPDHGYIFGFGAVVDKSDRLELNPIRGLISEPGFRGRRFILYPPTPVGGRGLLEWQDRALDRWAGDVNIFDKRMVRGTTLPGGFPMEKVARGPMRSCRSDHAGSVAARRTASLMRAPKPGCAAPEATTKSRRSIAMKAVSLSGPDYGLNATKEAAGSTTKQFWDACEHYVVAMLGFANVPAQKMPDCWPAYDVIAQPHGGQPTRVAVQGRRWPNTGRAFRLQFDDGWDWFGAVLRNAGDGSTRCWILPRNVTRRMSTKMTAQGERRLNISIITGRCGQWEGNFTLSSPTKSTA